MSSTYYPADNSEHPEYVPLSQDEEFEKLSNPDSPIDGSRSPPSATLFWGLLFFLFLAVNVGCLLVTTRQVNVVFAALKGHADFLTVDQLPKAKSL